MDLLFQSEYLKIAQEITDFFCVFFLWKKELGEIYENMYIIDYYLRNLNDWMLTMQPRSKKPQMILLYIF